MSVTQTMKELLPELTRSERKAAEYMISHPVDVVRYSSSDAIAGLSGCSRSAVVRLAKRLGFSGFHEFKIQLAKEPVDLYYLLVQLSDELSPVFAPHGNSVVLNMDENLTVRADPDKLVRVFGNILRNAAAYSDPKTEITISAEETAEQVRVSFQNQGDHIPAEKLSLLFDKFYRLDKARVSDTGGTGLGLAIAKEIILLHGGSIHAESGGHSVTITVCLPRTA